MFPPSPPDSDIGESEGERKLRSQEKQSTDKCKRKTSKITGKELKDNSTSKKIESTKSRNRSDLDSSANKTAQQVISDSSKKRNDVLKRKREPLNTANHKTNNDVMVSAKRTRELISQIVEQSNVPSKESKPTSTLENGTNDEKFKKPQLEEIAKSSNEILSKDNRNIPLVNSEDHKTRKAAVLSPQPTILDYFSSNSKSNQNQTTSHGGQQTKLFTYPVNSNPYESPSDESKSASDSESEEDEYEVESVLDYCENDAGGKYLITWKNYDESHNTWEPPENLQNCSLALAAFYLLRWDNVKNVKNRWKHNSTQMKKRLKQLPMPPYPIPWKSLVTHFFENKPATEEEVVNAKQRLKTLAKDGQWPKSTIEIMMLKAYLQKLSKREVQTLREQLLFMEAKIRDKDLQMTMTKWKNDVNRITEGCPIITIKNDVDLTKPPKDFTYVNDYVPGNGVTIPNDPVLGCSCEGRCGKDMIQCCAKVLFVHDYEYAYDENKRLRIRPGIPIFECNSRCKCGPECTNRVVQKGTELLKNMEYSIFRTSNGRGWGVMTNQPIKKGTFVCLYVGEIIVSEEADRRGKIYDSEGMTYLFDLDFNGGKNGECPYVVDAAKLGNMAHFINHSCDPNLRVFSVWHDCVDPNLPKLALFAIKDISVGEELTFDYINSNDKKRSKDRYKKSNVHKPCRCGAKNCRGILF